MVKSNKIVATFHQNLHLTAQFERGEINSKTDWAYGVQMFMINLVELQQTVCQHKGMKNCHRRRCRNLCSGSVAAADLSYTVFTQIQDKFA